MVGAFAGTAPLLIVAGLALFIAGLDTIEGLSQDVDHPDRRDSFPVTESRLDLLHLAAPIAVMTVVNLIAVAIAAAFDPRVALQIGLPLALPAAVTAVGGSVVNTLRQPPRPEILMMDSTGLMQLQRVAWPPGLSTIGPLLAWTVHRAALHGTPVQTGATNAALGTMAIGFLVLGWVRQRQAIATSMAGGGLSAAGK